MFADSILHFNFFKCVKTRLRHFDYFNQFDAYAVSIYYYLMQNRLPEIIEPLHLADKRGELHGHLPIKRLSRLHEKLVCDSGFVVVSLYFGREGRLAKIEGSLETTLLVECQNCLQGVEFKINNKVKLAIASTIEQMERLPTTYEPLLLEEETVLLSTIIEDELLLTLPDYPKHLNDCMGRAMTQDNTPNAFDQSTPQKSNPFSVLANLKITGDS